MLAGDGLKPSSTGKRVKFSGTTRTVLDGPFSETKELIAGYWLWQVNSMEEAVEWVQRCPKPHARRTRKSKSGRCSRPRTFQKRRLRSWPRNRSSVRRSPLARSDNRSGGVCIVA